MAYNTLKGTVNFSNTTTGSIESMVDDYSNQTVAGVKTFSDTVSASAFWDTTLDASVGNVTGVDSATDRSLMVADGTSGKAITGSIVTMDPAGNINAPGQTFTVNQLSAGGSGVVSTGPISGSTTLHAEGAATFSSTVAATGSVTAVGLYSTGPISGSTTLHAEGAATFSSTVAVTSSVTAASVTTTGDVTAANVSASVNISASSFYGDGSNLTGITAAGTPGGSDTQVQFNSGSSFGGSANFVFVSTGTNTLKVVGDISASNDFQGGNDAMFGRDITAVRDIKATNDLSASNDIHAARDLNIGRDVAVVGSATAVGLYSTGPISGSTTLHAEGAATFSSTIAATSSVTSAGIYSTGPISGSTTLHAEGAATFSSTIAATSSISASAFYDTTLGTAINVTGVDSAVDRSLMVANGTSGKAITGSIVTMDPAGNIDAGPTTISANKFSAGGSGVTSTGPISGSSTLHAEGAATFSSTIAATSSVTSAGIYSTGPISGSTTLHAEGAATFSSTVAVTSSVTSVGMYSTGPISGSSTLHAEGAATFSSTVAATSSVTAAGLVSTTTVSASTEVAGQSAKFATLHISGSETEGIRVAKGASDTREIVFENDGTDVASIFMNAAETLIIKNESSNDDIQFQTSPGGTARTVMVVDGATPNVGIGTISPLTALDVRYDVTGSLSDDTGGGDVVFFGTGTLTAGKLYYLHTDSAWTETDADAVATGADQLLGIALGADPVVNGVLIRGFFDAATYLSNFSAGKALYVSTTAASMDTTAPSAAGDFVRIVGYCTTTANVMYFNPSSEWIELA